MEHARYVGRACQFLDRGRRIVAGGDDLDVANRFLSAPERPRGRDPSSPGELLYPRQDWLDDGRRAAERDARDSCAQIEQRCADLVFDRGVQTRNTPHRLRFDRGGEIGSRGHAERGVERGKLLDGDSVRFEEPAKIARQIGDRRFAEDPRARVEHVLEATEHFSFEIGCGRRGRLEKRTEIGVGGNRAFVNERCRPAQNYAFRIVAPDVGQCGELFECAPERNGGGPALIGRNFQLAFQRARLGRRLAQRFFRFRRQVRRDPLCDAALECRGTITCADQLCRDARARQFMRIGIVDDDLTIAGKRRPRRVGGEPDRAGQLHGAVLVGIFQARVDEDRTLSGVEPLLQFFFGNPWDRHGPLLSSRRAEGVNLGQPTGRKAGELAGGCPFEFDDARWTYG